MTGFIPAAALSHHDFPRSIASVALMSQFARDHGRTLEQTLDGSGLTAAHLADPHAHVSAAQELTVATNLATALTEENHPGLDLGRRYRTTTFGIFGFACLASPTLGDALSFFLRYFDLTFAFCVPRVEVSETEVVVRLDDSALAAPARQFLLERDAAAILTVSEDLFPGQFSPTRVEIRRPQPSSPAPFEEVFHRVPIFDQPENIVAFDPHLLAQPLPRADPRTLAQCEEQCRQLVTARRHRHGIAAQVRDLLTHVDLDTAGPDEVARALHISTRTMRRRLGEAGTSYQILRDEVRETLAEQMLSTGALSVHDVAIRLGYAESASFIHAFKRWKGLTPKQFQIASNTPSAPPQ
ncbi:AraC family transcriptional regulator [Nocardia caishijiensis]|uniref:AraC family transcriptional regulator n=1 Tax=Nocardia caishijiensis TaxID=184756 RepID=A0ABQ6YRF3_9NOCA|nr:AraC family transcriptional regulator [Nocardia caishijiensis]KAF0848135.1 AraC family transcriptional regulator [Nocardia caishijiensis]